MQFQNRSFENILRKDYPEIAAIIDHKIKEDYPSKVLEDHTLISGIVADFTKLITHRKGEVVNFKRSKNRYWCELNDNEFRWCKVSEIREFLFAVVLKFYNPSRLLGDDSKTKYSLIKTISIELNISKQNISNIISKVVFFYKMYAGFRSNVDHFYSQLESKYFK